MAVSSITVAGLRSLREVKLDLGPVTVLIGANGSGKSNVLSVFRLLNAIRTRSLGLYVGREGGASTLVFRGPDAPPEIRVTIETSDETGIAAYGATLGPAATDEMVFIEEFASETPGTHAPWQNDMLTRGHRESRLHDAKPDTMASRALQRITGFCYYHFHDTSPNSPLRSNARAIDHRQLQPDGANLAAYLLFLRQSQDPDHKAAWTLLTGLLGQIAPFIRELHPTPVNADPKTFRLDAANGSIDKVTIRLDWIDESGNRFGMHQLSDGTLRALALFAALTQPGTSLPAFIVIDEPELGLHPAALLLFAEVVRSVSHRCQVLLATQSNALIDQFRPEEVVVAERVKGATELRRLNPTELAGWLEDYSLGQLFDMNVLGGRP